MTPHRRTALASLPFALLLLAHCSDGPELTSSTSTATTSTSSSSSSSSSSSTSGTGGQGGQTSSSSSSSSSGTGGTTGSGGGGGSPVGDCPTTFTFKPGGAVQNPRVVGEWNGFDPTTGAAFSGPNGSGEFTATVPLAPGLWGYKIVYEQNGMTQWILDPLQGRRKYVGGIENSGVKVRDCHLPTLSVQSSTPARPAPGQGTYAAELSYVDVIENSGTGPMGVTAVLENEGDQKPLSAAELSFDPATGKASVKLTGLADGKYRVVLTAKANNGKTSLPVRLVFWIEAEAFSWQDALIYMVVTDRFKDGDPGNNPAPIADADPRGDYKGGDLEGLRQGIADGTLDKLGVRAIWLTPFVTNPSQAYLASDGVHKVTGYHGYWPIKGREVEPRLGGESALHAVIKEAHKHGIRILQDFVLNHVHQDHEYVAAHPDWFRNGCVCGTNNCDWTAHALDCKFADYLPDINHTVPEATAAFVSDAVYWLDQFGIDGLRVDAVKHVEEIATRNLAAEVRETFELGGTRHFLMGETAMGWNDCADPCNDENYGTIAKYVGPLGLDGQFDFVLYHGVSYRTFAYSDKGMLHADYWLSHGLSKWPAGAIMTPYIGSHDTARFATLADYRGQDQAHDRGIPGNQWSNTAGPPQDGEPYARTRIGMAWLLNLPGAPLLYYGDEYGQWGGADPNNRLMWRDEGSLNANESATLSFVRKLGMARKMIAPLRRGGYQALSVTEDTLIFGRKIAAGNAAIVGLTRSGAPQMAVVDVAGQLGLQAPGVLHDAMGGPDVAISPAGKATVVVPAGGAVVLSP
ncbi:MAG: alpha-amylase family glycosyl hydrolase [Byssovorax sp.]